jgi:alpha-beta hydrolase superfamily lysophospholipase
MLSSAVAIVAVAVLLELGLLGWTRTQHELLRSSPKGNDLAPDFRGLPGRYIQNSQHLWLHYDRVMPTCETTSCAYQNARVIFIHGLGEDASVFKPTATFLASQGAHVFSLDQVGHGLSEGDRFDGDWQVCCDDISICSIFSHRSCLCFQNWVDDSKQFFDFVVTPAAIDLTEQAVPPYVICVGSSLGASVLLHLRVQPLTRHICEDGIIRLSPLDLASKVMPSFVPESVFPLMVKYFPKAPAFKLDMSVVSFQSDSSTIYYRAAFVQSVQLGIANLIAFTQKFQKVGQADAAACPFGFGSSEEDVRKTMGITFLGLLDVFEPRCPRVADCTMLPNERHLMLSGNRNSRLVTQRVLSLLPKSP